MDPADLVGTSFPSGTYTVPPWMAYIWADATRNENDAYRSEAAAEERGLDGQLVPPSLGMHIAWAATGGIEESLSELDVDWDAGVYHGGQSYTFHRPIRVGETYHVEGEIAGVERKQGKSGTFDVVSLHYEVRGENQQPAFESTTKAIVMREPG